MTVIFFFMASSLPSVYPFRFAWTGFGPFIAPLQAAEDPIGESCRFRGPNGGSSHQKSPLRSRTQLQTKPRCCMFFFKRKTLRKRKSGSKIFGTRKICDFEKDLGDATNPRGFFGIESKISKSISMAPFCYIQVATSVARARPEPPVIPKSKSWETNWKEHFWYPRVQNIQGVVFV